MKRTWKTLAVMLVLAATVAAVKAQDQKPAQPAAPAAAAAPAPAPPPKPDPSGTTTGTIADVPAKEAGKPTLVEVADAVGHNRVAINIMWTLLTGFLVMFMQAGFALAETGFTRAKNVAHTMMMNFMIYAIGMTGYWIMGFALQMGGLGPISTMGGTGVLDGEFTISLFGKDFGLFGTKGFFLAGSTYDVGVFALFLFQMVFMDTAATIPTGAMAERWKFSSFFIYGFFISMITYPLFANWVWGGGWLSQLGKNFGLGHGYVDFAGSSVVHMVGGVTGLAGAMVLGPRLGKYNKDGTPNPIPGHNIPMAALGCFILAFGWFGFNPGSTLAGSDLRIAVVAVNTMLASASGAIFAMLYMWLRYGKPDPSMAINGMLAGLVAITAPCLRVELLGVCDRRVRRRARLLERLLPGADHEGGRSGRRDLRARHLRCLGSAEPRDLRRRHLRRRLQRRCGNGARHPLRRREPARGPDHRAAHELRLHLRRLLALL